MRIFTLFEMLLVLAVIYLLVNIIRYIFFRTSNGGAFFGLSDKWIETDINRVKKQMKFNYERKKENGTK